MYRHSKLCIVYYLNGDGEAKKNFFFLFDWCVIKQKSIIAKTCSCELKCVWYIQFADKTIAQHCEHLFEWKRKTSKCLIILVETNFVLNFVSNCHVNWIGSYITTHSEHICQFNTKWLFYHHTSVCSCFNLLYILARDFFFNIEFDWHEIDENGKSKERKEGNYVSKMNTKIKQSQTNVTKTSHTNNIFVYNQCCIVCSWLL